MITTQQATSCIEDSMFYSRSEIRNDCGALPSKARFLRDERRCRQRFKLWQVLLALLILSVCYILTTPGSIKPPPSDNRTAADQVRVFFTTPTLRYPDVPKRRALSPVLHGLIDDIAHARTSVEVAAFDFDLPQLVNALIQARRRGVTVRAVIDSENLVDPAVAMLTGRLQDWQVPITFDRRAPFMHNKFVVIDDAIVWTGSWNLTENCTFRNNNNAIRIKSRQIAAAYRREFDQMHAGTFGTAKRSSAPRSATRINDGSIEIYFSPQDKALPFILEQIEQTRSTLVFMAFSFTSAPIADALIDAAARGVHVEGVIEKRNAGGTGSVFALLRNRGIDVREDGNCYIMHHKVIIIDNHIVITGSYNFTSNAENTNDENLAIIRSTAIARLFLEEYARIGRQATEPTRCN
jgi:phosphatidylserine/phosphatidylglycerophosphate/cardiolipin synthase-like enzyme